MGVFSIFKSGMNGQYYYRLYSGNFEQVLGGEGYTHKQSCKDGIQSVKNNCGYDFRYEKLNKPENYRFNLKGGNGEIIGVSEGYKTAYGRDQGIEAVKRLAPTATIQDLT